MNIRNTIKSLAKILLKPLSPLIKRWALSYSSCPKKAPRILIRLLVLLDLHLSREATLINGYKMIVDPFDAVGGEIYRNGQFEPETVAFVIKHLKEGMTFIDIGANIGQYTLLASKIVGDSGQVVTVEAVPDTFAKLDKNISINNLKNVIGHNVALSDTVGYATFHLGHYGNSGASSLKPTINTGGHKIKVKLNTLDNILADSNKADIMKIDVEGAEFMVLSGGRRVLEELKPMLILEFSDESLTGEFATSTADLISLLNKLNYAVFTIEKDGLDKWDKNKTYPAWYNVACIQTSNITDVISGYAPA